ncbi:acyltransferase family protein [Aliiglaciecola sp.]|nr:acyltransferase family protein [Aliiglaciecola sp.]
MTQTDTLRRYDVDWLRTLAFSLLIFYHIGMYYVQDWGWHIKSDITFRWLQEVMILTNTWRMSLLFFISAMVLSLVLKNTAALSLIKLRSNRLLIPLLFGMFVVVFPQVDIEAMSQNLIEPGVFDFWTSYINPNTDLLTEHHSSIGLLTWNHLWFLPYLWVYSMVILSAHSLLASFAAQLNEKVVFPAVFIVLCFSLIACWMWLAESFPVTHGLTDDWYNHSKYMLVFIAGYLFARADNWWQFVIDKRRWFFLIALLGYSFIIADRNGGFVWLASQYQDSALVQVFYGIVYSANHWGWIFLVIGYAGKYLTKSNRILTYANKAILPWYMFHQTVIVVIAWNVKPMAIHPAIEFFIVLGGTVFFCYAGYELVKRTALTRLFFGLKS